MASYGERPSPNQEEMVSTSVCRPAAERAEMVIQALVQRNGVAAVSQTVEQNEVVGRRFLLW